MTQAQVIYIGMSNPFNFPCDVLVGLASMVFSKVVCNKFIDFFSY